MANITIVATGGIRAPSQLDLAARFLADGHEVRCIATRNAMRFLSSHVARKPGLLRGYAGLYRPQLLETFAYYTERPKNVPHVNEGKWADVMVMCPASCNSVGKLAAGISDNYALLVLRAVPRGKPVIVVPSMNPEMWFDPQFQRNVDLLNATEKYRVICPSRGLMQSGDYGFGAQAGLEHIVAETYAALGILPDDVAAAISGQGSVPWEAERPETDEEVRDVILIDEDVELRTRLRSALEDSYEGLQVHEYHEPAHALADFKGKDPALVFTELKFRNGASGYDVIERFRSPGSGDVQIIATSDGDRREAGAEGLARLDVLYLPKPLNVPFAVGMVAGCLKGGRRPAPLRRLELAPGEVLFRQGEPGTKLYVIGSGRLAISIREGDIETEVGTVGEKELVGEMSLFRDGIRSATATAVEPTVVTELQVAGAREFLAREPAWMRLLIQTLATRLLERDRNALELSGAGAPRDVNGSGAQAPAGL